MPPFGIYILLTRQHTLYICVCVCHVRTYFVLTKMQPHLLCLVDPFHLLYLIVTIIVDIIYDIVHILLVLCMLVMHSTFGSSHGNKA